MNPFVKSYLALKPHRTPAEARAKYNKHIQQQQQRNQLWKIVQEKSKSKSKFVVIADIHSTPSRPHFLVMPRLKVVGLEDPRMKHVRDIFTFAWNVRVPGISSSELEKSFAHRSAMCELEKSFAHRSAMCELEKCLIVNPKQFRSQDQLHVHVVPLASCCKPERFLTIDRLDNVVDLLQPGEGMMIWKQNNTFCVATENKFSFEMRCIP